MSQGPLGPLDRPVLQGPQVLMGHRAQVGLWAVQEPRVLPGLMEQAESPAHQEPADRLAVLGLLVLQVQVEPREVLDRQGVAAVLAPRVHWGQLAQRAHQVRPVPVEPAGHLVQQELPVHREPRGQVEHLAVLEAPGRLALLGVPVRVALREV